ncbi:uncharacterized protein LOC130644758 [Hydractinia symbiolongicarpus]|uniref:uncharacterized protein LOC130644758 n=1 Tax=Hydractinia symbiolongicarpus TaxID=13093 RepID=UPI00254E2D6B|nr:uncharacterized protein LOC130644758 [Hydractinia symbiolongicarpus]
MPYKLVKIRHSDRKRREPNFYIEERNHRRQKISPRVKYILDTDNYFETRPTQRKSNYVYEIDDDVGYVASTKRSRNKKRRPEKVVYHFDDIGLDNYVKSNAYYDDNYDNDVGYIAATRRSRSKERRPGKEVYYIDDFDVDNYGKSNAYYDDNYESYKHYPETPMYVTTDRGSNLMRSSHDIKFDSAEKSGTTKTTKGWNLPAIPGTSKTTEHFSAGETSDKTVVKIYNADTFPSDSNMTVISQYPTPRQNKKSDRNKTEEIYSEIQPSYSSEHTSIYSQIYQKDRKMSTTQKSGHSFSYTKEQIDKTYEPLENKTVTAPQTYTQNTGTNFGKNSVDIENISQSNKSATSSFISSDGEAPNNTRIKGPIKDAVALPVAFTEEVDETAETISSSPATATTPATETTASKTTTTTTTGKGKKRVSIKPPHMDDEQPSNPKEEDYAAMLDELLKENSEDIPEKVKPRERKRANTFSDVVNEVIEPTVVQTNIQKDETDHWEEQDTGLIAYLKNRRPTLHDWLADAKNVRRRQSGNPAHLSDAEQAEQESAWNKLRDIVMKKKKDDDENKVGRVVTAAVKQNGSNPDIPSAAKSGEVGTKAKITAEDIDNLELSKEDIAAIENCPIWLAWLGEWIDEEAKNCDWGRWLSGKRRETDLEIKERIMLRTLYPTPTYQDGLIGFHEEVCLDKMVQVENSQPCFVARNFEDLHHRPTDLEITESRVDKNKPAPKSGGYVKIYCNEHKKYENEGHE